MVRGIKKTVCLLSFFVLLVCLVACGKEEGNVSVFEKENANVFSRILWSKEADEVIVESMDAYYYEGWFFYRASVSKISATTNDWKDYEFVYFGYGSVDSYINLNWPESSWEHDRYAQSRDRYYEAVESAEEHKSFSKQQIQWYIDEYYASREADDES